MDGFGVTSAGRQVDRIMIGSDALQVAVLTYGAALQSVRLAGVGYDLTCGAGTMADCEGAMQYHGVLVGPVANRLTGARVEIAGKQHALVPNEGGNLLHAGPGGIHARVWEVIEARADTVTLGCRLVGDGFPGRRQIWAEYRVTGTVLRLEVTATTDAATVMNIAQHSYWNLGGAATWAGHRLQIAADAYLPTDEALLPTGEVRSVAGTAFDFRNGRIITPGDPAMDLNFCVSDARLPCRAVLWLQGGDVTMAFATTEPGVQVYDGAGGVPPYAGLAIEAQGWPDAPHHAGFPSVDLHPGDTYQQITEWRFGRV